MNVLIVGHHYDPLVMCLYCGREADYKVVNDEHGRFDMCASCIILKTEYKFSRKIVGEDND